MIPDLFGQIHFFYSNKKASLFGKSQTAGVLLTVEFKKSGGTSQSLGSPIRALRVELSSTAPNITVVADSSKEMSC